MSTKVHFCLGLSSVLAVLAGCALKSSDDAPPPATSTTRSYSGTASVGDFLTVSLNLVAHTMHYHNVTNGDDYDVTYTQGSDGGYTFTDPSSNLVSAYEVPGFAMVIKANKAGPLKDTEALITAVQTTEVTTDVFKNKDYNYMQFRTSSGGMELGHVHCAADGTISPNGYWPYGNFNNPGGSAFNTGSLPLSSVVQTPDKHALDMSMPDGMGGTEHDYIFATPAGFLAVDTPNGAIVCMQQRTSTSFDAATMAGSYKTLLYAKSGATTGMGNVETSASHDIMEGTVTITTGGHVAVTDANGAVVVADTALVPISSRSDLRGAGKLENDCPGFFCFSTTDVSGNTRDVFVAFMNDAALLASFKGDTTNNTYDYFYGVALRGGLTGSAQRPRVEAKAKLALLLAP